MARDDVLIAGAGPTGLVLALWLTKQGIKVRIVDKTAGPGSTSRAMAVQARTLELYRQLDLADELVAAGRKNPAVNLWVRGRPTARVPFTTAGAELTPFPFVLIFPQDLHERLLIGRLEKLGVAVERETELVDFEDDGESVTARLRTSGGAERISEARYLAGCDGARSTVRHQLDTGFAGGTYNQIFYVADVEASGPAINGEVHVALERSDFVALFAYGHAGQTRLIGTVQDDTQQRDTLTFADVGHRAIDSMGIRVRQVNWFSTYRVHHRVSDRFRRGRAFLLGDAAHVHSPAGGQGMNTGIGDAINLAWKLAAVVRVLAPDSLLDSYELERQVFARKLVETTDRIFNFVTAQGSLADFVRTRIAPFVLQTAYSVNAVREFMFRLVSQTQLNYRGSPLSTGKAGAVSGGDRLPWVACDGADNFETLVAIGWQIHVYGSLRADLQSWCRECGVPLHVYPWRPQHVRAGLAQDAAYLLRPDTYVALADPAGDPAAFENYLRSRGIRQPPQLASSE